MTGPTNEPHGTARWLHRHALAAGLWTAGVPSVLALGLLWIPSPPPIGSLAARWTLTLLVLGIWWIGGQAFRGALTARLQTLSNVVCALREGDYSIRAGVDEGLVGEIATELNRLASHLRQQRLEGREATVLIERVVEEIGAGLFAFDGQRRIVLANRLGAHWLDRRPADLIGELATDVGLAPCLTGEARQVLELELPRGPGRYDVRRSSFRSEGRQHELVVLNDLTRALAAEERHAWKRMVQVLRHEINNSLAPIRSVASMLRTSSRKDPRPATWDEDLDEGLELIVGRSDALGRIIESFRTLTRLPSPQPTLFAVADWVTEVAKAESRLDVVVEGGPDTMLMADRGQLDQLLLNVVNNAVDAAAETGGGVVVRWSTTQGAGAVLKLDVIDDGPGLSGQENLFVPFFTTKKEGTGLGLALSRQIAEAHAGRLTLSNREDGEGCRARLRLPLSPPKT